jgi:hypothetical protein
VPIRYRYNSSSPWTYSNGDRWELNTVDAQCRGIYIYPKIFVYGRAESSSGEVTFNNFGRPNSAQGLVGGLNSEYSSLKVSPDRRYIYAECVTPTGQIVNSSQFDSFSFGGSLYRWTQTALARIEFWLSYNYGSSVANFKIDPATFNPDAWGGANSNSCTVAACNFKVFSGQTTILNLTYASCPEVEIAGCPPNTCDVLCGNTICCYGADGVSVLNFPNT